MLFGSTTDCSLLKLRCMGFGFWQAWSLITYSNGFLNAGPGAVLEGAQQVDTSALMMLSLIGVITSVILLPLLKKTDQWLITRWFPLTGGLLAACSTLVVCCTFAGVISDPLLFYAACFLDGIGNGILCLAYGPIIGSLPPAQSFLMVCDCMVLCCVVYFVGVSAPFYLRCVFSIAIPLISGTLAAIGDASRKQTAEDLAQRVPLTMASVRFFIAMLIVAGAASFIRSPFLSPGSSWDSPPLWEGLGAFIVLISCVCLVLYYQLSGHTCKAELLYYSISLFVVGFLVVNLIVSENGNSILSAILAECASVPLFLMNVAFDTIIFYLIYQSKMSPSKTMGISHGFKSVGILAGSQLGFLLVSTEGSNIALTCLVIFCVVVALVGIAPERVLSVALIPIDDHDADPTPESTDEVEAVFPESMEGSNASPAIPSGNTSPAASSSHSLPQAPKGKALWRRRCDAVCDTFQLTAREQEVLRLLSLGHGSEYISEQLVISLYTARTHVRNIYSKTGVHSREELIQLIKTTEVDPTQYQPDRQG